MSANQHSTDLEKPIFFQPSNDAKVDPCHSRIG
ncbi:MAG: hypothetical protein V7606_4690 [Burkholderiales bacterium]